MTDDEWKSKAREVIETRWRPIGPFVLWTSSEQEGWSFENHPTLEAATAAAAHDPRFLRYDWCITAGMFSEHGIGPESEWTVNDLAKRLREHAEREAGRAALAKETK